MDCDPNFLGSNMICIVGCKCCSLPSPKTDRKRSTAVMTCRQCTMRQAFTQQWVRLGLREKAG